MSQRERRKAHHVPSSSSASTSATTTTNNGDGVQPEKRIKLETASDGDRKNIPSVPTVQGNNSNFTEKSFIPVFDADSSVPTSALPEGSDRKFFGFSFRIIVRQP